MTRSQAEELREFGSKIQVQVTTEMVNGVLHVNFRDYQLANFIQAALILQQIQRTELPESIKGMVA